MEFESGKTYVRNTNLDTTYIHVLEIVPSKFEGDADYYSLKYVCLSILRECRAVVSSASVSIATAPKHNLWGGWAEAKEYDTFGKFEDLVSARTSNVLSAAMAIKADAKERQDNDAQD